jgi:hypothetical protein
LKNGRGGEIRTHDLLYPKQARYQATLRPDAGAVKMPGGRKNAITNLAGRGFFAGTRAVLSSCSVGKSGVIFAIHGLAGH